MPPPSDLPSVFSDVDPDDWTALVTSLRGAVRGGAELARDVLTLASAHWRMQLQSPLNPQLRERARRLLILLRERRAELLPVAEAVLAEVPPRGAYRGR